MCMMCLQLVYDTIVFFIKLTVHFNIRRIFRLVGYTYISITIVDICIFLLIFVFVVDDTYVLISLIVENWYWIYNLSYSDEARVISNWIYRYVDYEEIEMYGYVCPMNLLLPLSCFEINITWGRNKVMTFSTFGLSAFHSTSTAGKLC